MTDRLLAEEVESVRGSSSDHYVYKIDWEGRHANQLIDEGPATLYLNIAMHKEYPPFYRHAWGSAFVSTTENGSDRFPVESLLFEITMDSPNGGHEVSTSKQENAAEVQCDTKYAGANTFGDFESNWLAVMTHPNFGSGRVAKRW